MEIEWKTKREPYLFKKIGKWVGLSVSRARVLPGRMLEHTNDFHEVNIALAGELTTTKLTATGKLRSTCASTGNLCITPAGQPISARWNKTLDNLMMTFEPDFVKRTAGENHFAPDFEFSELYKGEDTLIRTLGLTLLDESDSDTPSGRLFTDSLVQTLTLHLLANYSNARTKELEQKGGLSGYKLRRVKEFIDANLEADISLAELAAVADLSQFHFSRAFHKTVGMTPQRYLMRERIERAKELLANGHVPIVEVGLLTGFKNQSHFTTLFRKFTNFTPKTWRDLRLA